MKIQVLFYVIGIIFLFATVSYFAYNYLFRASDMIKTVQLVLLIVVFYFFGNIMEGKDI
ncbi:hypothetical protein HYX19_03425 [Candidatus Woesearchaeota archaeon]|nr:hypothetical protein [Candidatus Woesearchaeota archaeon]